MVGKTMKYYTSEMAGSGQHGVCLNCKKGPTKEGHDGCLGVLPGPIMNACCGHGNDRQAYIQYWGGYRIGGIDAIEQQAKLIVLEDKVLELSEACNKLAELMENDEWAREHKGEPIHLFHDHLVDGETPAMAIALVKKAYYEVEG